MQSQDFFDLSHGCFLLRQNMVSFRFKRSCPLVGITQRRLPRPPVPIRNGAALRTWWGTVPKKVGHHYDRRPKVPHFPSKPRPTCVVTPPHFPSESVPHFARNPQALQNNVSAADALLQSYKDYLREDRGLTENSLLVYVPFIRDFLAAQTTQTGSVCPKSFGALIIRNFILEHTLDRSSEYARLLCTALRSFFRFLLLCGQTSRDLSNAVPMFRKYRQSVPPAFLSPSEVEQVLAATGSTLSGRRDHAILLLLARLGLRGGEVVALELDDVRWRAGEIVVRGKGRMVDHLPLLSDVGEALAVYIREDRGVSASRRVFLRIWAPHNGLTGPAAVGHIVRRALAQAGVHLSGRGAAHLFRHGLATKMIRHGASISEIAEVLRHRSQTTTAIYAQVSFEALREVALPWPAPGGAR
jgi:integrase/recombinase XerD